ncbi:Fc.00g104240.m01.CDS01 [Cosmosporella sp. VM-42]
MKPATVIFTVFGLAAAQKLANSIPKCAVECLEKGVSSATDCSLDDSACICEVDNYRDTYDAAQACVLQACGAAKSLEEVLPSAAAFCSDVTEGATAPPVDDSASATASASKSTATGVTTASAGGNSTTTTGTADASIPTTTDQPDGAAAMGSIGGLGMLALGVLAVL